MKASAKYRICIGCAIPVQIVFLCIAICASWRVDHFVELPGLILLFPFHFVAVDAVGWTHMDLLQVLLAIVYLFQWPIYGWFVGVGWVRDRLWQHASAVAVVHVLAAIVGLRHFSN